MTLVEVQARGRGGELLFGCARSKIVATWRAHPEFRETMAGGLEVGIDRTLTAELSPGMTVALAPDGSGSVVLEENLGPWDDRSTLGPLTAWRAAWATDAYTGPLGYPVSHHAG